MGASSIELAPTLFVARRRAHQVGLRLSSKRSANQVNRINQANAAHSKQAPQPKQALRRYLTQHL
ncbi:hypothetical protein CJ186_03310 [Actinomyces graevenitzii]|nr:hypothetical protein CJ186_03310 [Actinomyces graevenitzii]